MKSTKIIFWVTTGIFSAMMLMSGFMMLTSEEARQGFTHLGFPSYFRIELGIAKLLGVIALVVPIRLRIKEWAYAGFAINLISAAVAHLSVGDPVSTAISPLVGLGILLTSYFTYHKLNQA
jgi:hypothetical protein